MTKVNIEALEKETYQTALKQVSNMLQRPDQLEKIEQYKRRVKRNINSKEGMLKTAMQTQLDGVKTGLIHLKTAQQDIVEIKRIIHEVEEQLPSIPVLVDKLKYVRDESMKHSQYEVSMENLKHIFNVPETVNKTRELIADGKLLEAHKNLSDLENSRDNLLFQLHRLAPTGPTNNVEKNTLKHYYGEVEKLSDELGKQLWLLIRLTLNSVRKEPSVVVTALRIIEREERSDGFAALRNEQSGFVTIGRPKNWRKRVFEILEEAVAERIQGNKFTDRSDNKMWLVLHLEMTRQIILSDLRVVKFACVSCFPPGYNILKRMLHMYHNCLSSYLCELVSTLEGNEYITLLNWLNDYEGPQLLGHEDLRFSLREEELGPLLSAEIVKEVTDKYLQTVEKNYREWLANTIRHESKDWESQQHIPELNNAGHYQTTTPVIVFQMIDQHLQVASSVSMDLVDHVLFISTKHLTEFARQYKDAVNRFAKSHFETRSYHLTPNMIAISNNCASLIDNALKFQKDYKKDDKKQIELDKAFSLVVNSFNSLKRESIGYLIKEIVLDIDKEISKVGSHEWLDGAASIIENVCLTLEDYFRDYTYLKESNADELKVQLQKSLAKSYIQAIMSRETKKVPLRNQSDRERFANKCIHDARMLDNAIDQLPSTSRGSFSRSEGGLLEVVTKLMEFLKTKDLSMLYLEISGMMKSYPDIRPEHFVALLSLREDTKSGAKKKVEESMPDEVHNPQNVHTIFSEINI